jgi:hypothetical protein
MSKSEDKIVKQSDPDSQEKSEKKECLLGNREDPYTCHPMGSHCLGLYLVTDFVI